MDSFNAIKKNWFNSLALFLGLILVVNLVGDFTQLDLLWKKLADKSLVTDEEKWRTWLNQNSNIFSSLTEGAQIGITKIWIVTMVLSGRSKKTVSMYVDLANFAKSDPALFSPSMTRWPKIFNGRRIGGKPLFFFATDHGLARFKLTTLKNKKNCRAKGLWSFYGILGCGRCQQILLENREHTFLIDLTKNLKNVLKSRLNVYIIKKRCIPIAGGAAPVVKRRWNGSSVLICENIFLYFSMKQYQRFIPPVAL